MANRKSITNDTMGELRQKLINRRAKNNFASRKTHTKKYAQEHNLYLPDGETSVYGDNIDWTAAIRGKYNVDFDTWSDIHWKSKSTVTRDLKNMTPEEFKSYKNAASRKCRFNAQLKLADIKLADFLERAGYSEDFFFSDEYQNSHKVSEGSRTSVYNIEYWMDLIVDMMPE